MLVWELQSLQSAFKKTLRSRLNGRYYEETAAVWGSRFGIRCVYRFRFKCLNAEKERKNKQINTTVTQALCIGTNLNDRKAKWTFVGRRLLKDSRGLEHCNQAGSSQHHEEEEKEVEEKICRWCRNPHSAEPEHTWWQSETMGLMWDFCVKITIPVIFPAPVRPIYCRTLSFVHVSTQWPSEAWRIFSSHPLLPASANNRQFDVS